MSGNFDNSLLIWNGDFDNKRNLIRHPIELKSHKNYITCIQDCLNSQLIISGDSSGDIILWDIIKK